jgi:nitrite reductase (NADH) large subunit
MSQRVVIIGGGMSGRRLAQLLPTYDVTVLGDEGSYNRTPLTEYVAGRAAEPVVGDEPVATAVAVDRDRRVVTDAGGHEWGYDRLVFATGAVPVVPAEVVEAAGIHTLRSAADAQAIVAASRVRRAVVLGGGVLGVETACALRERGVAVTLVHDGETLLNKTIRPSAGRRITRVVRELAQHQARRH